ncbi:MAG: MBL fold metallo-hydrolase [Deltaproteobacteria bacterium]|nr:MBL fold metallo-hydrolase [Deltaproteobacteria bacterium]
MLRVLVWVLGLLVLLAMAGIVAVELRTRSGGRKAEEQFAAHEPLPVSDFGTTKTLSILPLVDWHTSSPELRGEMGVSYLIETDEHRILFDVGQNTLQESPSPLEHNMKALGVTIDSIDTLFISHNHFDHVGGKQRQKDRTFSMGLEQVALPDVRAFVPIPMTYPGLSPVHAAEPTLIGNGVASTGTIPRQLVFGWIDEQALVVHVAERGAVLIVGCGHQTIPKLLERYDQVFSEPLYGIVGGLHFPVPEGRLKMLGLNAQRILASGQGIFAPITMDDVKANLASLEARKLGLIGVGGHDSSDEVIAMFSEAFDDAYRHIRVGERVVIGPPE